MPHVSTDSLMFKSVEPIVAVIVNQIDVLQKKGLMLLHWRELLVVRNHIIFIRHFN